MSFFVVALMLGAAADPGVAASPPELGAVRWHRGFSSAADLARRDRKPLLVLFQEVPGCATCVRYGAEVLSHPLIVEAAETLFVPVAVYNNIKGDDQKTLKSFKEPSWNNPVVRIVSADRSPLSPRLADDYTIAGLADRMCKALRHDGQEVPKYLQLLAEEMAGRHSGLQKATLAMHCFWEGEAALGQVPGVCATLPGMIGNVEVVELEFNPKVIEFKELITRARDLKCASQVFAHGPKQRAAAMQVVGEGAVRFHEAVAPDRDPNYYLSKTPLRHVPMTSLQACRVNAAVGLKGDPRVWLSPRQLQLLQQIRSHPATEWPDAIGVDLTSAWSAAQSVRRTLDGSVAPAAAESGS